MPTYQCELCNKTFKQKNDLRRHKEGKLCVTQEKYEEILKEKESQNMKGSDLNGFFKSCLNHLRNDSKQILGESAFYELSRLMILKLVEKHISNGNIDMYDLSVYDQQDIEDIGKDNFKKIINLVKLSEFNKYVNDKEKENQLIDVYRDNIWKLVLAKHPIFKNIFLEKETCMIEDHKTIKKLVNTIYDKDLTNCSFDVLGEAYEKLFTDVIFGAGKKDKSEMGQFFTPSKVKKLLLDLVKPIRKEDGVFETLLDPACGTGGILNTVIKNYIKLGAEPEQLKDIIYGIEKESKAFTLCLSNMLIHTGEIMPNVIQADSIRKFHNIKVDTICANPPFSVTIDYDDLHKSLGDNLEKYIPIKVGCKSSEVLFLQMMIYCLKLNGRCSTVWLDGCKVYGKTSGYREAREYLMKSCDLKEVILCPAKTFTSTASKTCIFYFIKKREVDKVILNSSKKGYDFTKTHQTKNVKFYDYNPLTEDKTFIIEVPIEKIAENDYSLNYSDYNREEEESNVSTDEVEWKELGEVCDINNGKRITREKNKGTKYPVYGGGDISYYTDEYNRDGVNCKISREGMSLHNCVTIIKGKFYLNSLALTILPSNDTLVKEYLWYYLLLNNDKVYVCGRGTGQKAIDMVRFKEIKIPIPSLEQQQKIVSFLDGLNIKVQDIVKFYKGQNLFKLLLESQFEKFSNYVEWQEQAKQEMKQKDNLKRRLQLYLKLNSDYEKKKLGDVCNMNPENLKEEKEFINYIDISSVKEGSIINITKLYKNYPSRAKRIIKKDDTIFSTVRPYLRGYTYINSTIDNGIASTGFIVLRPKNIVSKYLYIIITSDDIVNDISSDGKGAQYPSVNIDTFEKIYIPIPPLEKQKEIVEYCENIEARIKQCEKNIELIKNAF